MNCDTILVMAGFMRPFDKLAFRASCKLAYSVIAYQRPDTDLVCLAHTRAEISHAIAHRIIPTRNPDQILLTKIVNGDWKALNGAQIHGSYVAIFADYAFSKYSGEVLKNKLCGILVHSQCNTTLWAAIISKYCMMYGNDLAFIERIANRFKYRSYLKVLIAINLLPVEIKPRGIINSSFKTLDDARVARHYMRSGKTCSIDHIFEFAPNFGASVKLAIDCWNCLLARQQFPNPISFRCLVISDMIYHENMTLEYFLSLNVVDSWQIAVRKPINYELGAYLVLRGIVSHFMIETTLLAKWNPPEPFPFSGRIPICAIIICAKTRDIIRDMKRAGIFDSPQGKDLSRDLYDHYMFGKINWRSISCLYE